VSASKVRLDSFGIENDRRYMLVDEAGVFVTQRSHPELSLLDVSLSSVALNIQGADLGKLSFMLTAFTRRLRVKVWSDYVDVDVFENDQTEILSSYLGKKVLLAFMSDDVYRPVDSDFCNSSQRVSFADGFPFLLTNQASLDDLNGRLTAPIPMGRFRPNIVFSGDVPFQEDVWSKIQIGEVLFDLVKPCSRCVMTTIDYEGRKGKEPLKTLSTYRKNEYGVCFGQNMIHASSGCLKVGDRIRVIS